MSKKIRKVKHGMSKSKEYSIWRKMKSRCLSIKDTHYDSYGGRGIKICTEWLEFINFYKDIGQVPNGCSLDRINVNGDYCKANCKWSSPIDQNNNKRNTVYIEYKKIKYPVTILSRKLKIPTETIKYNTINGVLSEEYVSLYKPCKNKINKNTFRKQNITLYKLYTQIKSRCKKTNQEFYEPWKTDFELFLKHIGPRPSNKHSIDRINNTKGYIPNNIRWATNLEQSRNKSNNHFLTINDKTLCITDWARLANTDTGCIRRRLKSGLSVKDAVFWKNKSMEKDNVR